MQLNAHVGVELVAVEKPDELNVLLEVQAPDGPTGEPRRATAVQVVLDRSGEALNVGDVAAARAEYQSAHAVLASAPPDDAELARQAQILAELDGQVAAGEAQMAAKASWMEHARTARERGRHDEGL